MVDNGLFDIVFQRVVNPDTVEMVRRALAQGVVLDTWMNGEDEEQVSDGAQAALMAATGRWSQEAMATKAVFPHNPMPEQYVRSVFHEILSSMALFIAQKTKGRREVGLAEVQEAAANLSGFIAGEPRRLTAVADFFFILSAHEDLNAIAYYGRIKKDDFLFGRLHRPWSNLVLNPTLIAYERMGLVERLYAGEGDVLALTQRGLDLLTRLRRILNDAGELKWRSNNQRWVIFGETDYDKVFNNIFPDSNAKTREYLEHLGLQKGMSILEVGSGTGRATIDLGLCDLVGPGGSVTALDPMAALIARLSAKGRERGIKNVGAVQGIAEDLPFPDNSFDAAIAVISLHFTDAPKAVAEMVRVTRPGGFVSAVSPAPEFDVRDIPMVALWFRPLSDMAERFSVPFSEHNGLPLGLLKQVFEQNLEESKFWDVPVTASAEDYQSFLAFMVRGAAVFQNIFCHLPFQERWNIMRRLEEDGAQFAAAMAAEEKRHVFYAEAAWGRVPATKAGA